MKTDHEHRGVKFTTEIDKDPSNPRKDFDHAAVMACKHGRYNLGDEDGNDALVDAIRTSKFYRDGWENEDSRFYKGDAQEPAGIQIMLPLCKDILWMPLYLYDHSGITMRTTKFSDSWDSGMVGFIFMKYDKVLETFVTNRITNSIREQAYKLMEAEVDEYDDYLTGDVYVYDVGEHNCGGYYGEEAAIEAAKEIIDGLSDKERDAIIAAQAEPAEADDPAED